MDRHDPLAPATDHIDMESDSLDLDSAGIDLSIEREEDDGSPTPAALAERARQTQTTPPAERQTRHARTDKGERTTDQTRTTDDDTESDRDGETDTSEERARDPRGRFTTEGEPPPAKRDRMDRRISHKRNELNVITRDLTAARAELQRIQTEKQKLTGEPSHTNPQTAAEATAKLGPKPDWKKYQDDGKSYDEFEKDRDEWLLAEAEARALKRIEAQQQTAKAEAEQQAKDTERREFNRALKQKFAEARAKHPDFDDVLDAATDAGVELHEYLGVVIELSPHGAEFLRALSLPEHYDAADVISDFVGSLTEDESYPLVDALVDSEDPARFALALADPKVQTQVREALRKPGRSALAALVRLDERLFARASGSQRTPAEKKSAAPPPSHRAGSHSAGAARASGRQTTDDYIRLRRAGKSPAEALRSA